MWQPLSVRLLWMCVLRKPCIRRLNWYGFKTHDFSAINIIKTKQMFFSRVSEVRDVNKLFWKRKPVSIWCDHHLPSPSHRVDQVVDCGLWNDGPLLLQWLCEVAGYWQELEHAVVYADPEHPKHAQWVTCPVSMLAMQELGCFQLPGIVYRSLQHGAVHYHATTWGDGRGWMAQQWASGSRHGISVHSKCHQ